MNPFTPPAFETVVGRLAAAALIFLCGTCVFPRHHGPPHPYYLNRTSWRPAHPSAAELRRLERILIKHLPRQDVDWSFRAMPVETNDGQAYMVFVARDATPGVPLGQAMLSGLVTARGDLHYFLPENLFARPLEPARLHIWKTTRVSAGTEVLTKAKLKFIRDETGSWVLRIALNEYLHGLLFMRRDGSVYGTVEGDPRFVAPERALSLGKKLFPDGKPCFVTTLDELPRWNWCGDPRHVYPYNLRSFSYRGEILMDGTIHLQRRERILPGFRGYTRSSAAVAAGYALKKHKPAQWSHLPAVNWTADHGRRCFQFDTERKDVPGRRISPMTAIVCRDGSIRVSHAGRVIAREKIRNPYLKELKSRRR